MYQSKFYTAILMIFCLFCGLLNAQNGASNSKIANFTQGKEYFVLEKPLAQFDGKFVKIFSYDCPICYKYDKLVIPKIVPQIKLEFEPIHYEKKGIFGKSASEILAFANEFDEQSSSQNEFITSKISLFSRAIDALYTLYHIKKERFDDNPQNALEFEKATILSIDLSDLNLSNEELLNKFNEWKTAQISSNKTLKKWRDDELNAIAIKYGLPTFIINGKFIINTKEIKSIENFQEIIDALSGQNLAQISAYKSGAK